LKCIKKIFKKEKELGYSIPTPDDILLSYEKYLKQYYPRKHKSFESLMTKHRESAKAEAVVFSMLRQFGLDPEPIEETDQASMDFLCNKNGENFSVEVTHITREMMSKHTGIPCEPIKFAGSFHLPTEALQSAAKNKAFQMSSGGNSPRVLAITTDHHFPIDAGVANEFMYGRTDILVPILDSDGKPELISGLKESVFFRFNNDGIEPCRQSISAILLINIKLDCCTVIGLLHPEPAVALPISFFKGVPFLKIKKWPIKDDELIAEYVVAHPNATKVNNVSIRTK